MVRRTLALLSVLAVLPPGGAAAEDPWRGTRAAFFGITFIDTSTEGALRGLREDEVARVALAEAYLADALRARGIDLVDLAPVREELDRTRNPARCNGCELRMARRLEADLAIVSEVQKVSNLILSMNVQIRDAATGRTLRGQAVDIRGNTDDSWLRGLRFILERNVFAGE